VTLKDGPHDGETQARTLDARRAHAGRAVEPLAETRKILGSHAGTVVRNLETSPLLVARPSDADLVRQTPELEGVVDEIPEGRHKLELLSEDRVALVWCAHHDKPSPSRGAFGERGEYRGHRNRRRGRFGKDPGVESQKVEKIAQKVVHPHAFAMHGRHRGPEGFRKRGGIPEKLEMPEEHRDRGAKFVRGVGEEETLLFRQALFLAHGTNDEKPVAFVERQDPRPKGGAVDAAGSKLDRISVRGFVQATEKIRMPKQEVDALSAIPVGIETKKTDGALVEGVDSQFLVESDGGVREDVEETTQRGHGETVGRNALRVRARPKAEDFLDQGRKRSRPRGDGVSAPEDGPGTSERHPEADEEKKRDEKEGGPKRARRPSQKPPHGKRREREKRLTGETVHEAVSFVAGARTR
jgi:hypothetical protein